MPMVAAVVAGEDGPAAGGEAFILATESDRTPEWAAWIERVVALQHRLKLSDREFAAQELGCTQPEWSRFKHFAGPNGRRMPERVVRHLVARHPELMVAYQRALRADYLRDRRPVPLRPPRRRRRAQGDPPPPDG